MGSRRKEFVAAYEALQRRPFPYGSADDTTGEFHAELILLDTEMSGLIAKSLGSHNHRELFRVEDDWRIQDLKMRLEHFIREARGEPLVSARQYLEYLNALRSVIELAKAYDS
jgi:hypothetical protein